MLPDTSKAILDVKETEKLFLSFSSEDHLLLAVSGGPDSLAMMQLAFNLDKLKLSAATVNHGLREEALGEAQLVAEIAAKLNIPHNILEWQGAKPQTRLQELARQARYDLLIAHALKIGASHILTAHTLDDQAETILFRMARGSGISGLIGMKDHINYGQIIHSRPFLTIAKERLVDTCTVYNLPFVKDKSNLDGRFARPRIRKIMPLLAEEGLTALRFSSFSKRMDRANRALDARVESLWKSDNQNENIYNISHISDEPAEIILRYLLKLVNYSYRRLNLNLPFKHFRLNRIENILEDFHLALRYGKHWKRSIAGLILELDEEKCIHVQADPRLANNQPK